MISPAQPLLVAEIDAGGGRLGLSPCPGARPRDLAADLDRIRAWGADVVLTLVEAHELPMLGVAALPAETRARSMAHMHLPIADMAAPGAEFEQGWTAAGEELRAVLARGGRVLIHCRGGLGRTGTVAARLLVEFGAAPADAVARVRAARPGAVETDAQLRYVLAIAPGDPNARRA